MNSAIFVVCDFVQSLNTLGELYMK